MIPASVTNFSLAQDGQLVISTLQRAAAQRRYHAASDEDMSAAENCFKLLYVSPKHPANHSARSLTCESTPSTVRTFEDIHYSRQKAPGRSKSLSAPRRGRDQSTRPVPNGQDSLDISASLRSFWGIPEAITVVQQQNESDSTTNANNAICISPNTEKAKTQKKKKKKKSMKNKEKNHRKDTRNNTKNQVFAASSSRGQGVDRVKSR